MSEQILWNPAALSALKRHQLVSLSKKYGLKAGGKNVDMVERLQEYASSLGPELKLYLPEPAPTPGPNLLSPSCISEAPSSSPMIPMSLCPNKHVGAETLPLPAEDAEAASESLPLRTLRHKASTLTGPETWEVLSESGASLVSPRQAHKTDSIRSWESARNGESMSEFGDIELTEGERRSGSGRSRRSSMLDFASSLKRSASKTLHFGRSSSVTPPADITPVVEPRPCTPAAENDTEETVEYIAPSPASTVGVPRRHSRMSLMETPSTLRLCSSSDLLNGAQSDGEPDENDALPFVGSANKLQMLKERRSMAPLGARNRTPSVTRAAIGRPSMPALSDGASSRASSIYPPLPSMDIPPVPSLPDTVDMPGAMPTTIASSGPSFGAAGFGVSTHQFSEAAQNLLKEMNAKLPSNVKKLDDELLKGKRAEIKRLVSVTEGLGEGGWGLSGSVRGRGTVKQDRFAEAHEKEFAKMQSIDAKVSLGSSTSALPVNTNKRKYSVEDTVASGPSAPNGLPLTATAEEIRAAEAAGPNLKRIRLSKGPNYLGSIRDAGKSLVNLLAEAEGGNVTPAMARRMKEKRDRRRSSLINGKAGKRMSSRFGFLKKIGRSVAAAGTTEPATVAPPQIAKPTSRESLESKPQPKDMRRHATDLSNLIKPSPSLATGLNVSTNKARIPSTLSRPEAQRNVSSSTTASASSSVRSRSKIPDFTAPTAGAAQPAMHRSASSTAAMGGKNTLGLPKKAETARVSSAPFTSKMVRKASQASVIQNARKAPPPPETGAAQGEILKAGSSTETLMDLDEVEPLPLSRNVSTSSISMAPPPPSAFRRSSTLYQPTASSMARMQATVKPNPARPLPSVPRPPSIAVTKPFGPGASRSNLNMFETGFHVQDENTATASASPAPATKLDTSQAVSASTPRLGTTVQPLAHAPSVAKMKQQATGASLGKIRSPAKSNSMAAYRARARAAGVSAIKSKANLKDEFDAQRRRTEVRAKQARLAEEKGLREMLMNIGEGGSGPHA